LILFLEFAKLLSIDQDDVNNDAVDNDAVSEAF
jgi:hypothetical protein